MEHGFDVGSRPEAVPLLLELGAKILEVVDLAVEQDRAIVALVPDRLLSPGDVDDAEAPKHECGAIDDDLVRFVGTTMGDGLTHPEEDISVGRHPNSARDPAHAYEILPSLAELRIADQAGA